MSGSVRQSVSFAEARQAIVSAMQSVGIEQVSLFEVAGRVVAHDIVAPWNMPQWDNTAMDGYAVRSSDCVKLPATLTVAGCIAAGAVADGICVESGCAVRIMTGAPIPTGCDAIVPVEDTDDGRDIVMVLKPVKAGQHVRVTGEDVAAGSIFMNAGTVVRPPETAMLAAFGKAVVDVFRQPVVAILSTGDELVEIGKSPGPGQVINSNALALAAAVRETGCIPRILGVAADNRESLLERLGEGISADVLITSAGVSTGDRDLVREVLAELGAKQLFCGVDIKPGKPAAFAMCGKTPVISLPGNPVSALITFEELVRPGLLKMLGHKRIYRPLFKAVLNDALKKKEGKVQIFRVALRCVNGSWQAESAGNQQTAILKTMVDAHGLAIVPAEAGNLDAGTEVDVHFYGNNSELTEVA